MKRVLLLAIAGAFMAGQVSADDKWYTTPAGATRTNKIKLGQVAYYQEIGAGVDDSTVLDVSSCNAFSLYVYRTGVAGTVKIHDNGIAPTSPGFAEAATPPSGLLLPDLLDGVMVDVALTGVVATGHANIYDIRGVNWIWVEITNAPAGADHITVRATCSG